MDFLAAMVGANLCAWIFERGKKGALYEKEHLSDTRGMAMPFPLVGERQCMIGNGGDCLSSSFPCTRLKKGECVLIVEWVQSSVATKRNGSDALQP